MCRSAKSARKNKNKNCSHTRDSAVRYYVQHENSTWKFTVCIIVCMNLRGVGEDRRNRQTDRQTDRQTHETVAASLFLRETERTDMKTQTHICWEDNRRNNIFEF